MLDAARAWIRRGRLLWLSAMLLLLLIVVLVFVSVALAHRAPDNPAPLSPWINELGPLARRTGDL